MKAEHPASRTFIVTFFAAPVLKPGGDPCRSEDHWWARVGQRAALTLPDLERELSRHRRALGKFQQDFFVGGALLDNRRLKANVQHLDVLPVDVDHGLSAPQVHERLSPWHHIIWHTYRHTPAAPRCRAVLPLARSVNAIEYARLWAWVTTRLDGAPDPQASDPSRACLLPPIRPDGTRAVTRVFSDAPLLDPDEVMPAPVAPVTPRPALPLARVLVPADRARDVAVRRLRESQAAREVVAGLLNAEIHGPLARRVACPRCGRDSVWFHLVPGKLTGARCDHRASCGWAGGLDLLLDHHGASHGI